MHSFADFPCGVIEGFYGRPWNPSQRLRLLAKMQSWGLNTYFYAPKDDLKHRALWREPYAADELAPLREHLVACRGHGVELVYAIAPGLDIAFDREVPVLAAKLAPLWEMGLRSFALLFDDIPDTMRPSDRARFGTFAGAQVHAANTLLAQLKSWGADASLWFCPTVYCGRFAGRPVSANPYLRELGAGLDPAIEVLWTGPQIISDEISVESIRELQVVLKRRPVIWDNLHANDYDLRRLYLGPLTGRSLALRAEVRGFLSNPNCEFEANFVPLHSLASYVRATGSWTPETALAAALDEWLPAFATRGGHPFSRDDLQLLVDLFCLPQTAGPRAETWIADFAFMVSHPPAAWGERLDRFERTCEAILALYVKITELADRELCFTFYRLAWEVQWEVTPMRGYVRWLQSRPSPGSRYAPNADHRPGIYRSGVVARLQHLMPMSPDGAFGEPARSLPSSAQNSS